MCGIWRGAGRHDPRPTDRRCHGPRAARRRLPGPCPGRLVVLWDLPAYSERFAARLLTSGASSSPYLLLAETLAGIREQLPPGLVRAERQPADPLEVVEIGFADKQPPAPDPKPACEPDSLKHPGI